MGSIDIMKPLFTVLSSAVNKSQQHQEENSWKHRESNPGLLGEKHVYYLCAPLGITFSRNIKVFRHKVLPPTSRSYRSQCRCN